MFAQLTPCSRKRVLLRSSTFVLGLFCWITASEAMADAYNFWLKSGPNTPYLVGSTQCAAGDFSFDKTSVTPGSPATNLTMKIAAGCIDTGSPAVNLDMAGPPLMVVVRDIKLNNQEQGPNVDGLTGTLTSQEFQKSCFKVDRTPGIQLAQWSVTFSSTPGVDGAPGSRTYDLVRKLGVCVDTNPDLSNPTSVIIVSSRPYHVFNTANQVPEPETLWLALLGLGGLALVRRKRN